MLRPSPALAVRPRDDLPFRAALPDGVFDHGAYAELDARSQSDQARHSNGNQERLRKASLCRSCEIMFLKKNSASNSYVRPM